MSCRICGVSLPADAMFCGECGSSTTATVASRRLPDFRPGDTTAVEPLTASQGGRAPGVDVEATTPRGGLPAQPTREPTFTLAFSTGEVIEVSGTGLVGRRPLPQPAEFFDALVTIDDRSLSVSKTHLEFGQHEGELWVNDRFSGNGTLIRRPDGAVLRCEPGRRYLVPRGSRLDLGDVSLVVS